MYWTDSEHYWKLLKILNRFWTFWTWTEQSLNIAEHSEHRLNRFWTLLNVTENSEQIHFSLNFSFSLLNQYILLHYVSQTKFGGLIVFAPFLIIIIILILLILLLSFRASWTCPRQISGTTGQNFMKLGGVIDICF